MTLTSYVVPVAVAAFLAGTVSSKMMAPQTASAPHAQSISTAATVAPVKPIKVSAQKPASVDGLRAVSGVRCAKRADMVSALDRNYREKQQASGLASQKAAVELFVSDTGDWTLLATGTNGVSCMMAAGDGWDTTNVASLPSS